MNDIHALTTKLRNTIESIDALTRTRWLIESEITRIMLEQDATEIPTDAGVVTLRHRVSYDDNRLAPMRELISEQELVESGAWTPSYQQTVTVNEKWNKARLKKLVGKRGSEYTSIIDSARIHDNPRITIEEK